MTPRAKQHPTPSLAGVCDQLVADIVSGRYPQGSNLPAERELAIRLGASRPTLREALRRLGEWGLVEPRRGSGVVVRDQREWSLDVLPAYLRLGAPGAKPGALGRMIADLLALRRALFLDVLGVVGGRVPPGSLGPARAAARAAWDARGEIGTFVKADFEVVRSVVLAAGFLPALWMMNGLSAVYLEIARTLTGAAMVPDDYLATHEAVCDALERKDLAAALSRLGGYLDNHDRRLLAAMGISS